MLYWPDLKYLVLVCLLTPEVLSVFTSEHKLYDWDVLASNGCVHREEEYSHQCTTVGKWIHFCLLHNWTETCNVSQSFNSNLPWPVMGYIIINRLCQLVQTNCWLEAINTWYCVPVMSFLAANPSQRKSVVFEFPFYLHTERPRIDAAHWPRTVISAKSGDEVDQPDGHCEVYDAGSTSCLIRRTRKDPTGLVGSVWMEQISKMARLTCCARPLMVHMADCHFLCVAGSLT